MISLKSFEIIIITYINKLTKYPNLSALKDTSYSKIETLKNNRYICVKKKSTLVIIENTFILLLFFLTAGSLPRS